MVRKHPAVVADSVMGIDYPWPCDGSRDCDRHSATLPRGSRAANSCIRECRKRAESAPTEVASGRTGVRAKAVIQVRARNWLHRPGAHLSELSADGREGRLAAARRVGEREVLWRCSNREIDERLFSLVRYPMCSSLRLSRAACHSTPQPEGMFRDIAAAHPPATQLVLATLIGSLGATGG